jgi:hypothetical protein
VYRIIVLVLLAALAAPVVAAPKTWFHVKKDLTKDGVAETAYVVVEKGDPWGKGRKWLVVETRGKVIFKQDLGTYQFNKNEFGKGGLIVKSEPSWTPLPILIVAYTPASDDAVAYTWDPKKRTFKVLAGE